MLKSELDRYIQQQLTYLDKHHPINTFWGSRMLLVNPQDMPENIEIYKSMKVYKSEQVLPGLPIVVTQN